MEATALSPPTCAHTSFLSSELYLALVALDLFPDGVVHNSDTARGGGEIDDQSSPSPPASSATPGFSLTLSFEPPTGSQLLTTCA